MTNKSVPLVFLSRRQFHKFASEGRLDVKVDTNAALDAAQNGLTNPPNITTILTASWALPIVFVILAIAAHPAFLLLALPPLYLVKVGREKCRAALLQKCFENDKVYDTCIKNLFIIITSDDPDVKRADWINSVDGVENADKELEVESFVDSFTVPEEDDNSDDEDEKQELTNKEYARMVTAVICGDYPDKFSMCMENKNFIPLLAKYITACWELDLSVPDCTIFLQEVFEDHDKVGPIMKAILLAYAELAPLVKQKEALFKGK